MFTNLQVMSFQRIGIIGAGAMGRGIAKICAAAGAATWVFDAQASAAPQAIESILSQWGKLVEKGKLSAENAAANGQRLQLASSLADLHGCDLVIEAIVERLDTKRELFAQLEGVVSDSCVLASNTSSLSVTAIAAGLKHPQRVAGYHFFNPVPLMKLVEVIAGLKTDRAVCNRLTAWAKTMGHTPVQAGDTPGFIVNHAGRGYGTEALRLVGEQICDFATTDRILRDQVGFKLGPFELMDLTALDVSHPVMESIYRQYFDEPRYRPSVITAQRLAAGVVGKKVGAGFYAYTDGAAQVPAEPAAPQIDDLPPVWVSHHAARKPQLLQLLKNLGASIETGQNPSPNALCLVAPLGLDITTVAVLERLDPARTLGIDLLMDDAATRRRVLATNPATRHDMRQAAHALFARDGKAVSVIRDSAGFVTQRVVGTIVNIATDMCQQAVCSPADLDLAVTLGLGYPKGPLALGDALGAANVLEVLVNMHTVYNDPRYRASPWLRRRAALGLSLSHQES
jgi:3-hydroxybutyryl-CoA dehydrogenase